MNNHIRIGLKRIIHIVYSNWDKFLLSIILLFIILVNFRWGQTVLGNDNYSPELNPILSLLRSLISPAWRAYRVLGIPSDSEQADVFRSFFMSPFNFFLPSWFISQISLFFAFFIGSFGAGLLSRDIAGICNIDKKYQKVAFFFGGLLYCTNLLTAWMFFSPLAAFVAGYAFLPLVLWSMGKLFSKLRLRNVFLFLMALCFLTTSSMVATTFIVEAGIFLYFLLFYSLVWSKRKGIRAALPALMISLVLFIASQLFWILPFIFYVRSNAPALQDSFINRILTPSLIEQEIKYNTIWNIPRFYFSWIHSVDQNTGALQVGYYSWFIKSVWAQILSFLPLFFGLAGVIFAVKKASERKLIYLLPLFFGVWFLIKGVNEPFGRMFSFLQESIPLFKQVFRWQSSKLFPALLLPLTLFAAIGITNIILYFDKKTNNLFRVLSLMTGIILAICLLLFVHPFFQGNLIGPRGRVQFPNEYIRLKTYLQKNYPEQRIYIAPEANSLYFRSQAWGFFGSSFLNYLVSNPLIEKALITGSEENETAQKVLESAYYSDDAEIFSQALRMYKTPLVLLDESSDALDNGYHYDWDTADKIIKENPLLQRVWQEGFLSLYEIKDYREDAPNELLPLYFGHNKDNLQHILRAQKDTNDYYSIQMTPGIIFPLALDFSLIKASPISLVASARYHGKDERYTYNFSPRIFAESPSYLKYNSSDQSLVISPGVPILSVNNISYPDSLPELIFNLEDGVKFISSNDMVFPLADLSQGVYVETPYSQISDTFLQWEDDPRIQPLSPKLDAKHVINLTRDSIVDVRFSISTAKPMQLNVCIYSKLYQKCMNKESITLYTESEFFKERNILLSSPIQSDDTLELYIEKKGSGSLTVNSLEIRIYEHSLPVKQSNLIPGIVISSSYTVGLKEGDELELAIPKIFSQNAFHFNKNAFFIPEIAHKGACYQSGILTFRSQECEDQMRIRFQPLVAKPLALAYYSGKNYEGIPLKVNIRESKSQRKTFEDQFQYQNSTNALKFFLFPTLLKTYLLELFNYSISSHPSITTVEQFSFQFIPPAWYSLQLTPNDMQIVSSEAKNSEDAVLISFNQAAHPNWKLSDVSDASPVRVNDWEQGWMVKPEEVPTAKPFFWPNQLAWLGYGIYFFLLAALFVWAIRRERKLFKK